MLVWGSGGGTVEAVRDAGVGPCSICQGNQPYRILLNYRFAHLWYLFSWITSRQYICQCTRCSNGYPVEPRAVADKLGKADPIPFMRRRGWMVGVALVVALGTAVAVFASVHDQDVAAYIDDAKVGDVYRADLSKISKGFTRSPAYGLMRLDAIEGDQFVFRIADKAYSKRNGVSKDVSSRVHRNAQYFSSEIVRLPRQQVHRLHEQSVIYDIDRQAATP